MNMLADILFLAALSDKTIRERFSFYALGI